MCETCRKWYWFLRNFQFHITKSIRKQIAVGLFSRIRCVMRAKTSVCTEHNCFVSILIEMERFWFRFHHPFTQLKSNNWFSPHWSIDLPFIPSGLLSNFPPLRSRIAWLIYHSIPTIGMGLWWSLGYAWVIFLPCASLSMNSIDSGAFFFPIQKRELTNISHLFRVLP